MAMREKREGQFSREIPREYLLVIFFGEFRHVDPPKLYWTRTGFLRGLETNFGCPSTPPRAHEVWRIDLNKGTATRIVDAGNL